MSRPRTPYSAFILLHQGLAGQQGWEPAWADAEVKPAYDAVIVSGGWPGHRLLPLQDHRISKVAVIEKGSAAGNTGRNTPVVRSDYFNSESVALYDFALRLYETLARELNYNVMLSQQCSIGASADPKPFHTFRADAARGINS